MSGTQTISGDANLIASNILSGKSIFGVAGTVKKQPTINVTLSGDYSSNITGYGAGINQSGILVIWAMTNGSTTAYENVSFTASSIIGTAGNGWDITDFDTTNGAGIVYACTVTGLSTYTTLNITLTASTRNATYDYTQLAVTITGS